ncbi:hypothetical protein [Lachnoclostridium sp. Marseille-P6806]|uniref:hypothetical protein n=1 Tax=Lachnoclostridium sp. Marseille-P6806 TaxID=2364793 RepID=UPI001031464B|nr:hypothetical protein [Lachnoclostridium sp. Marseille-P6806]
MSKLIAVFFLIINAVLFVRSLFCYRSVNFLSYELMTAPVYRSPLAVLPALVLFAAALLLLRGVPLRAARCLVLLEAAAEFCLALLWCKLNTYPALSDQKTVWANAGLIATGYGPHFDAEYYSFYPHQRSMTMVFSWLIKMTGRESEALLNVANAAGAALIVVMTALLVKELTGEERLAPAGSTLAFSFVSLLLYCSYIYGTVLSLTFAASGFWFALRLRRAFMRGKLPRLRFTLDALGAAGSLALSCALYSSMRIAVLAAVIFLVSALLPELHRERAGNAGEESRGLVSGRLFAAFASPMLILLLSLGLPGLAALQFDRCTGYRSNGGFPVSTWVSMGISSNAADPESIPGGYDKSPVRLYEETGGDMEQMDRIAKERIRTVLAEYRSGERSADFFRKKLEYEWLDPWFGGAQMTCSLWMGDDFPISAAFRALLTGPVMPALQGFLAILLSFVYGMAAVNALFQLLDRSAEGMPADFLPELYFLGGFLFQIVWEANSRYCLPYYVLLFPLALHGLERLRTAFFHHGKFHHGGFRRGGSPKLNHPGRCSRISPVSIRETGFMLAIVRRVCSAAGEWSALRQEASARRFQNRTKERYL